MTDVRLTAAEIGAALPPTVRAGATVSEAWSVLHDELADEVVVLDGGICLGVVEAADVLSARASDSAAGRDRSIMQLVTATPAVTPETDLIGVCRALVASHSGSVLVLDDSGALRGVVGMVDVIEALAEVGVRC